jgi:hypothetical protein
VQHIALKTDNIFATMRELKKRTHLGGRAFSLGKGGACVPILVSVFPCFSFICFLSPSPFSPPSFIVRGL